MRTFNFKVGDHEYAADRMPTITQFHVARRMSAAVDLLCTVKQAAPETSAASFARIICGATSPLPMDDVQFALDKCLDQVKRVVGAGLQNIRSSGGQLQFDDLELDEMLQIVYHVLDQNGIIDFFRQPPASDTAAGPTA